MPWKNENDLRDRLAAILPQVHGPCPDPQCGDSTWDHDCELGGSVPDVKLANLIAVEVQAWLRTESSGWRAASKAVEDLEPSSAAAFSLRMGADALSTLALAVERQGSEC